MTILSLFAFVTTYRTVILIGFAVVPVVAFVCSLLHGVYDGRRAPWRHIYSALYNLVALCSWTVASFGVYAAVFEPTVPVPWPVVMGAAAAWVLTILFIRRVVELRRLAVGPGPVYAAAVVPVSWAAAAYAYQARWNLLIGRELTAILLAAAVWLALRLIGRVIRRPLP